MPYIPPEVLQEIKKVDLKTYLKEYEPRELVHFSGDVDTTRTHDSIKISKGKWTWWGTGIGGRTALDYLIKVRGLNFMEAAELMLDQMRIKPLSHVPMPEQEELNTLVEEGMMNVNFSTKATFDGKVSKSFNIKNIENNHDDIVFEIFDEKGESIYKSKKIAPGYEMNCIELDKELAKGRHECTI